MGISPSLEIAKRALIAQRLGLDTTSSNVANVNTPGYSRRVPTFREGEPLPLRNGFVGNGVLVSKLRTFREEFFDRHIRRSFSNLSTLETDNALIQKLATILGEPGDQNTLNSTVMDFLNSFQSLSLKPSDIALRERTISLAKTMLFRFKEVASQIQDAREQILNDFNIGVDQANRLIKEIADLNFKIASAKSKLDGDSQTFVDLRESKLEELSKLFEVNITQGDYGTVNVFLNGINLVTGASYSQLKSKLHIDSLTNEKTLSLVKQDLSGRELASVSLKYGKLGSLLEHYNVIYDNFDSSGGMSIATELEKFFSTFITKINSFSVNGYGLTDTTAPPPGRNFFVYSGILSIATTDLNSEIVADVRKMPLSAFPNEHGDTSVARQIANLASDKNFLSDQTPDEYLTNIIGQLGNFGEQVASLYSTSKTANEQLLNQRESLIGVNLDEEAINLIKFQKAFEAASRVVSTTNDILGTLVNLGR
ncbi:MAG: flagellar hook-associated protein FlgK [Ignavibacteria bacterium]|nr:flagellar hook-associated protein FlgK [Ignavibacteria bacterium]